jgi:hypothetical protein
MLKGRTIIRDASKRSGNFAMFAAIRLASSRV